MEKLMLIITFTTITYYVSTAVYALL